MKTRPYRLSMRGFRARAFAALGSALTALRKVGAVAWSIALCGAVLFQGSAPVAAAPAAVDRRPYHERRLEMPCCPECLDPECFSINCDERGEDGR